MNRLQCLIRLARALDYNRDPDPKHWKTINGAKVHLDKNGNYDGGAGGKFNGNHHYGGPDWKQKTALMNQLTNALRGGVTQKQAQGNQAGNDPSQNVASKATNKKSKRDKITADNWRTQIGNATSGEEWIDIWQEGQENIEIEINSTTDYAQRVDLFKELNALKRERLLEKFEDYTPTSAKEYQAKFAAMGIRTDFSKYTAEDSGYKNMKAFDDNLKLWPKFREQIKKHDFSLEVTNNPKVHGKCGYRWATGDQHIDLNETDLNDPDMRKIAAKNEISSGFKMPATPENYLTYTINHETGHAIENAYIEWACNGFPGQSIPEVEKSFAKKEKEIRREILNIAKKIGHVRRQSDCLAHLSRYGGKDAAEFFAECYANYRCGAPNLLGRAIGVWLERWNQS